MNVNTDIGRTLIRNIIDELEHRERVLEDLADEQGLDTLIGEKTTEMLIDIAEMLGAPLPI